MVVPIPIIQEPKSSIPQNHIPLLDRDKDNYDSVIIYENWLYNRDKFHFRILHDHIYEGVNKNVNKKEVIKGGFQDNPRHLDWAEMIGPIRSLPEPPP